MGSPKVGHDWATELNWHLTQRLLFCQINLNANGTPISYYIFSMTLFPQFQTLCWLLSISNQVSLKSIIPRIELWNLSSKTELKVLIFLQVFTFQLKTTLPYWLLQTKILESLLMFFFLSQQSWSSTGLCLNSHHVLPLQLYHSCPKHNHLFPRYSEQIRVCPLIGLSSLDSLFLICPLYYSSNNRVTALYMHWWF